MTFFSGNNTLIATELASAGGGIVPAGANTANMSSCAYWDFTSGLITTVGSNGGPSAYGTYDMNGNSWEWTDLQGISAGQSSIRGGGYGNNATYLASSYRLLVNPWFVNTSVGIFGFRVSSYSNPLSFNNFLTVDDSNNSADSTGYGSVSYSYKISKYMTTICEYAQFLNAVAATDTYGLYNLSMGSNRCGLLRSGSSGSYTYSAKANYENKPIIWISWFNAARYCNWLHNNKPSGSQNSSTTEDGAYTLNGVTVGVTKSRNSEAKYVIPSENEWYKAAYYKGAGINSGYWTYATQKDIAPTCVIADAEGDGPATSTYTCL